MTGGSAPETELDAQFSGMIAPGSSIHVFTSAENDTQGEIAMYTAILDDNRAKVVNYSWGMCEENVNAASRKSMDKVLARAVAQGVNFFVASGDTGSHSCGDTRTIADWPALHPGVIAVGGTSLYLNSNGGKTEKGWSGSGGGVSATYPLPKWQAKFKKPFVRRSYPDIAFNADPMTGQGIWIRQGLTERPSWQKVGGTSMAAPQWVGLMALVNQARQLKQKKAMGYLNPILYGASANEKARIFTDITIGKNGDYSAALGWDAVTGLGTPKAYELLQFLLAK